MDNKTIFIAVILILIIFVIMRMRKKQVDNYKNKKPYRNKKNKNRSSSNNKDEIDILAKELYDEFHELFMDEEVIDEDDLQEIDDRLDDVILIEFTQLYNSKDHYKIKIRDYGKILKKHLNDE